MWRGINIIAEIKTKSPFGFESPHHWTHLFGLAESVGDMISVHTAARWGGSLSLLKTIKSHTKHPVLAKGIHANDSEIEECLHAGADLVLVVGRVPAKHLRCKCVFEPLNLAQIPSMPADRPMVWNQRDLDTGERKEETFAEARLAFAGRLLWQASLIRTVRDIQPGACAVIVGQHLPAFAADLGDWNER